MGLDSTEILAPRLYNVAQSLQSVTYSLDNASSSASRTRKHLPVQLHPNLLPVVPPAPPSQITQPLIVRHFRNRAAADPSFPPVVQREAAPPFADTNKPRAKSLHAVLQLPSFFKNPLFGLSIPLTPRASPLMGDMANEIKLLTGNSHPTLARLVADRYVARHPLL